MVIDPYITEEFTLTLRYSIKINTETGEIVEHKLLSRTVDKSNFELVEQKTKKKSSKKEESSEPQLILDINKYELNKAALELLKVEPGAKLGISYMKQGKELIPVLEINAKDGCKLTKSNTVSCKGSKREELVKYGEVFTLVPYEGREELFILKGEIVPESLNGDTNITAEEIDETLPLDVDLQELIEEKDETLEEIDSEFFKF